MNDLPQPVPCHSCTHPYLGAVCPICKEERPTYTALKAMSGVQGLKAHEKPYDDETARTLDSAVVMLGGSDKAREIVKFVYALGRIDGGLALIDKQQAQGLAA